MNSNRGATTALHLEEERHRYQYHRREDPSGSGGRRVVAGNNGTPGSSRRRYRPPQEGTGVAFRKNNGKDANGGIFFRPPGLRATQPGGGILGGQREAISPVASGYGGGTGADYAADYAMSDDEQQQQRRKHGVDDDDGSSHDDDHAAAAAGGGGIGIGGIRPARESAPGATHAFQARRGR
mmetsp:Transcript_20506/g.49306  ORF Transcript_20506/g.49306 Transcript_20506/m.49306 type:complete len:181 (+) Transcript_20506:34-576(+)